MTIFNNSFPEIDQAIISFTPPKEQISLSGVNKTAYCVLSNNLHFKELFIEKFPCFKEILSQLFTDKQSSTMRTGFENICNEFPTNCWKIFCYVLQTGDVKFNDSSLKELLPKRLDKLTTEKNTLELGLKNICGSYYEDPSSPIHQAWQAYQENTATYSACEKEVEKFYQTSFIDILGDRQEEWQTLEPDLEQSLKYAKLLSFYDETVHETVIEKVLTDVKIALVTFDEKLAPLADLLVNRFRKTRKMAKSHEQYLHLENQRSIITDYLPSINNSIDSINNSIDSMKNPAQEQLHLSAEQKKLSRTFEKALELQLLTLLSSTQTSQEDLAATYSAFKMWAALAHPYNFLHAIENIQINHPSTTFTAMLETFAKEIFYETGLQQYASLPIKEINTESFQAQLRLIQRFYNLPAEHIRDSLLTAIKKIHGITLELEGPSQ